MVSGITTLTYNMKISVPRSQQNTDQSSNSPIAYLTDIFHSQLWYHAWLWTLLLIFLASPWTCHATIPRAGVFLLDVVDGMSDFDRFPITFERWACISAYQKESLFSSATMRLNHEISTQAYTKQYFSQVVTVTYVQTPVIIITNRGRSRLLPVIIFGRITIRIVFLGTFPSPCKL